MQLAVRDTKNQKPERFEDTNIPGLTGSEDFARGKREKQTCVAGMSMLKL